MKQKGEKLCGEPKPEDENINKFVTEKCTTDQNLASDINTPVMKQKENNKIAVELNLKISTTTPILQKKHNRSESKRIQR